MVLRSELKVPKLASPVKRDSKIKHRWTAWGVSHAEFWFVLSFLFSIVMFRLPDYLRLFIYFRSIFTFVSPDYVLVFVCSLIYPLCGGVSTLVEMFPYIEDCSSLF